MRIVRVLLVIVAVVCLGVAVSYPIRYHLAQDKNDTELDQLAQMRQSVRRELIEASEDEAEALGLIGPQSVAAGGDAASDAASFREDSPTGDGASAHSDGSPSGAFTSDGSEAPGAPAPEGPEGGGAANIPEGPQGASDGGAANIPEGPQGASDGGAVNVPEGPQGASDGGAVNVPEGPQGASHDGAVNVPEGPQGASDGGAANAPVSPPSASEDASAGAPGSGDASAHIEGGDDGYVIPPQPAASAPEPTPEPTLEPNYWDLGKYYAVTPSPSPTPKHTAAVAGPTLAPSPTPDRSIRKGPLPYALKEKVVLDKAAILPELKDIYALNNDLVGWINIPDTVIDYPVVQAEDGDYYLSHDFYGEENINGQIILDALCDPYTPSYNLIVSGHHMKNGSMFGGLPQYRNQKYWEKHKFLELDTLMERKHYVLFACFYSADYDEDETGFRYNAIIDYKMDADHWLEEIAENQLYDTGIEREFGDEFITLTTCDRTRHHDGRFVVVGRRIREGETFE